MIPICLELPFTYSRDSTKHLARIMSLTTHDKLLWCPGVLPPQMELRFPAGNWLEFTLGLKKLGFFSCLVGFQRLV